MPYGVRFKSMAVDPNIIDVAGLTPDIIAYMNYFGNALIADIRAYPPVPTGSTYQRTGALGLGWKLTPARFVGNAIAIDITNTASDRPSGRRYMQYVQGPWQTGQHASTGWKRVDQARDAMKHEFKIGMQSVFTAHLNYGVKTFRGIGPQTAVSTKISSQLGPVGAATAKTRQLGAVGNKQVRQAAVQRTAAARAARVAKTRPVHVKTARLSPATSKISRVRKI